MIRVSQPNSVTNPWVHKKDKMSHYLNRNKQDRQKSSVPKTRPSEEGIRKPETREPRESTTEQLLEIFQRLTHGIENPYSGKSSRRSSRNGSQVMLNADLNPDSLLKVPMHGGQALATGGLSKGTKIIKRVAFNSVTQQENRPIKTNKWVDKILVKDRIKMNS